MQSKPDPISEPILFSKSWAGSATKGHLEGVSRDQGGNLLFTVKGVHLIVSVLLYMFNNPDIL